MKIPFQIAALSLMGLASTLSAAPTADNCCTTAPAVCYPDSPPCAYCVGPDMVNPSVRPRACDGSFLVILAGFYWNSHQDGMEFAIDNSVSVPPNATLPQVQRLNNLIDAEYLNPNYKWDFGFKAGLAYNSTHDGWDLGIMWTWYRGSASNHVEAESDDNHTLIPLWSAWNNPPIPSTLYASDIETHWSMRLNLADVELGREFWISKYLTFRPHIGLRFATIDQNYKINHKGGSWATRTVTPQLALNNEVNMSNDFCGVGARGGLNTVWNLGRGFAFTGNTALSIVYGRFKIKHDEWDRVTLSPHDKERVLETEDHFRASRAMTDLTLGLQWSTPFGQQCQYGFTLGLAWEHHMFFDQNQLWRVNSMDGIDSNGSPTIENVYYQRRGDLDTQGWTVTVQFEF
ncbi:MAG: hypothetical protein K940chlam2_00754 [Chlamydiae bacterium]|nr:hypothetical protein [Chlamydiota bacterium]